MQAPIITIDSAGSSNSNILLIPSSPSSSSAPSQNSSRRSSFPPAQTITSFTRRVSFDNYQPTVASPYRIMNSALPQVIPSADTTPHTAKKRKSILKKSLSMPRSADDLDDSLLPGSVPLSHSTSYPSTKYTSLEPHQLHTNNDYTFNNSLQSPTPLHDNLRKKSYSELSDHELLSLDSQFNLNKKSIDFQKDYGFNALPRLSSNPVSNCNKDSVTGNNFKNLNNHEYPTKPIITKNSICFNYRNYKGNTVNNRYYLILLSNKSSSLSSIDYYLKNYLEEGDSIVFCCSLSTSILGNDKSAQLYDVINSFTSLILNYLESSMTIIHKVNITFEFFKSFTYLNEVLNLYQPRLILIGTNNEKTKSTSLTNEKTKKLISVVNVGLDYCNNNATTITSPSNIASPQVTFKIPFKDSTVPDGATNIPHSLSDSSYDSFNSDSKLTRKKTNDTAASSIFDNLNDIPNFDGTTELTTTLSPIDLCVRRRSMLDVLPTDDFKSSENAIADSEDDDEDENENENEDNSNGNTLTVSNSYRRKSSNNSIDYPSPNGFNSFQKEKNDLFERYNRRLSNVKVGPQNTPRSESPQKKKKGFFSKFFK